MLTNSWQTSLRQLLNQLPPKTRIAIVGIGNTFRCDDAAGVLAVRALMDSRFTFDPQTVLFIDAGHAPENCTADLRRFAPEIVLLIDAADMDELPGAIRWIEMDQLDGMSASTHTLPLSMLAKYLTLELNCTVALLGIQSKFNGVGEVVSVEVKDAIAQVTNELATVINLKIES